MFYLHVTPPPSTPSAPSAGVGGARLLTPSRPKSASPAICVPTLPLSLKPAASTLGQRMTAVLGPPAPRHPGLVGFSPRVPSAPRPSDSVRVETGNFQHVLQASSPRHGDAGVTSSMPAASVPSSSTPAKEDQKSPDEATSLSFATSNVYHAMTARKNAEETAKQLARRIVHFKAQEDKVLREVQQMKQRLEQLLIAHEQEGPPSPSNSGGLGDLKEAAEPAKASPVLRRPMSATAASRMAQRTDVRTPRSRDQLQFLTKQRRVIQTKNAESARVQKEKRQAALELQRQKDAAEQTRRAALKERIRRERQCALEQRAVKQHQLLGVLEQQHYARLMQEQTREQEAQRLIDEMREEERNIVLRLQALKLHQEHIRCGLVGSLSPSSKRQSPPRPKSARPATARPRASH